MTEASVPHTALGGLAPGAPIPLANGVNNIHNQLDIPWQGPPLTHLNGSLFSLGGQFQIVEEDPVGVP